MASEAWKSAIKETTGLEDPSYAGEEIIHINIVHMNYVRRAEFIKRRNYGTNIC